MSSINRSATVARNPEVLYREVEGETVLLDASSGTYYTLNETGTAIWNMIENPTPLAVVQAKLIETFDVSHEDAWDGVLKLVAALAEQGLAAVKSG